MNKNRKSVEQSNRSAKQGLAALVVVALMFSTALAAEPIYTKNDTFFIPFTLPETTTEAAPSAVELYVSGDRGENWTLYQQRNPAEKRFSFRAGVDGEFWFSIRNVNANGQAVSDEPHNAEMVIVVDRKQPMFELTANAITPGQVQTEWRIVDLNNSPESVRMEYKTGLKGPWQTLSVHGRSALMSDGSFTGKVAWSIPQTAQDVFIRAEVRDRADNLTVVERQIASSGGGMASLPLPAVLPDATLPQVVNSDDAPKRTVQAGPTITTNQFWKPNRTANSPDGGLVTNSVAAGQAPINNPFASAATNESDVTSPPGWNNDSRTHTPLTAAPALTADAPAPLTLGPSPGTAGSDTGPSQELASNPNLPPTPTWAPTPSPTLNPPAQLGRLNAPVANNFGHLPESKNAALDATFGSQLEPLTTTSTGPIDDTPAGNWLMSTSRRFNLDYDVEATGQANVHRIEVWFTEDGGRSWQHHGDDDDGRSPYLVTVADDGLFGFRLLIQSRQGLAVAPPEPGDQADIWIRVDTLQPRASFQSAVFGRGTEQGRLSISWSAEDENLMPSPITLLYSDNSEGPWRRIATDLPNTGRYYWQVDDRTPQSIYLRMQVKDQAGNITTETLSEPIRAEGLAPKGRINGFRPASHEIQAADAPISIAPLTPTGPVNTLEIPTLSAEKTAGTGMLQIISLPKPE